MPILLLFLLGCTFCQALYEDQIGKFDWSAKHLGCPNQILFGRTSFDEEHLIISSKKNTLGKINVNSGDIEWRQLNEPNASSSPEFSLSSTSLVTMVNNGEYFRSFEINNGILNWQLRLGIQTNKRVKFVHSDKFIAIISGSNVYGIVGLDRIKSKWLAILDEAIWIEPYVFDDIVLVAGIIEEKELHIVWIKASTGQIEKVNRLAIKKTDPKRCILTGTYLVCVTNEAIGSLFVVDIIAATKLESVESNVGVRVTMLEPLPTTPPSYFLVHSIQGTHLCHISQFTAEVKLLLNIDRTQTYAIARLFDAIVEAETIPRWVFAAYYEKIHSVRLYDIGTQKLLGTLKLDSGLEPAVANLTLAPVESLHFVATTHSTGDVYQLLVSRKDCRIDFFEARVQHQSEGSGSELPATNAQLEWVRLEALASISSVEMIDLPLSEAQAQIETEFGATNEPAWRSFVLRLNSQMEQFRRFIVSFMDRIVESLELVTWSRAPLSSVLKELFGYDTRKSGIRKSRTATVQLKTNDASSGLPLERDFFNLRKIILVTTLHGSVYGISNDDGRVLWSLYLGVDAIPYHDRLGKSKVPLFVQRGTSHFQFASQAAIVFNSLTSKDSHVLVFDPVTGHPVDRFRMPGGLARVELFPFSVQDMLQPLLLLNNDNQIKFYPVLPKNYVPPRPIYLFFVDPDTGTMTGKQVDFERMALVENWRSQLPGFNAAGELAKVKDAETIVAIAGKSQTQKVHSQGRVLGDRSVLYKYINPNLVAVVTVNEAKSELRLSLVDSVTGIVVYSGIHGRVQPPVHLVHCENWLTYTYWNEKARRMELGIVELYEGMEQQTDAQVFDSYMPLKWPLQIVAQAYIFPQGINAMAATETAQGLTTRSVIFAMPFGGILEVSRRFLDARRPIEMTAEMREEMMIPYMPELLVASEDLISYNQTILNVHGIKTAPSGLESTSLVFAYGLDLFYTRVMPSGTFDILKDDFDYILISAVMVVLIAASFILKRITRYNSLKQKWS